MLSGIDTCVRFLHPEKALSPIAKTVFGIFISSMSSPEKAPFPIEVIPSDISIYETSNVLQ